MNSEAETVEVKKEKMSPLPDVGDLLFIGIMYILLFGRPDYLFQDASICWHLQAGKNIAETHSIPYTDLFSYTFPDKAWVAYEWLFDLVAYLLTQLGGYNLLAVCISGFIGFVLIKMYDYAREQGGSLALATVASLIGILASAIHWLARPHIVTFLGVTIFVAYLDKFENQKISAKKLLCYLTLMMILWVNCHPAFLLGIAITGVYFGISLISALICYLKNEGIEKISKSIDKTKIYFVAGLSITISTLVNPYGWNLHQYILSYLGGNTVLKNTDEFLSPVFHGDIHALCLEILFLMLVVGLSISKRKLSVPYLIIILAFIHLSLSAVRNIPLFALVCVPALGFLYHKTNLKERMRPLEESLPKLKEPLQKITKPFIEFDIQEKLCKMRILSIVYFITMVIAACSGGSLLGVVNLSSGFNKTEIPTKTLDYIKENKLAYNKGFNFDNWGGLIRYNLDQRVFIDDRADFYGEDFYIQYGKIVQTKPGWEKLLEENKIEWVLMPSNTLLVQALKEKKNWSLACEDAASSLFVRNKN